MSIDRRFLNVQLLVDSVANTPASTSTQYIVGSEPSGAFQGAAPNSIAYYNSKNEKWIFITPNANVLEVFNISTKEFLRWNGNSWSVAASLSVNIPEYDISTFYHAITQEEIENKSITIELLSGAYSYIYAALFLDGVLQRSNQDFSLTISGNTASISWADGFNDLDIRADDIITLQLMTSNQINEVK